MGVGGDGARNGLVHKTVHRCLSHRQIEASSQTAMRMLLSRLKLVCRIADVHLGNVRVVHLKRKGKNLMRVLLLISVQSLFVQNLSSQKIHLM